MNDRKKLMEILETVDRSVLVDSIYNCVFPIVPNIRKVPPCPVCAGYNSIGIKFAPKEQGLMTLEKAFMKACDNDFLYHPAQFLPEQKFKKKHFHKQTISGKIVLSGCWQIIPAEPKVLSDEDIKNKVADDLNHVGIPCSAQVLKAARMGIESGRLKEWLNHKELREAIKGVFSNIGESKTLPERYKHAMEIIVTDPKAVERVYDALKNLKPL